MSDQIVPEIDPLQAWDKLAADDNAVLIDVRSSVEFAYVGHPPDAINIPWQEAPLWQINPDFAELVKVRLQDRSTISQQPLEDTSVLLICRSGARSMAAAVALKKNGFKNVFNVSEGFEGRLDNEKHRGKIDGWRFHNLPWVQT